MIFDGKVFWLEKQDPPIPDEILDIPELKIRLCGFKHLEALAAFPPIVELTAFNWPTDSFAPLQSLTSLRTLILEHCTKVHSLEPLAGLVNVERLTLVPSIGSYKTLTVDSLRPLASLHKLRYLDLRGLKTTDNDLSPLCGLKELVACQIANLFPQAEHARLAALLPRRIPRVWFLRPHIPMGDTHRCDCGTDKVMLTGSDIRPRIICPKCQAKKFQACVRQFEELVAAAKAALNTPPEAPS